MSIDRGGVNKAIHAGLTILKPESEVPVPAGLVEGLYHLKQLLTALGNGEYALVPTMQEQPKPEDNDDDAG